jgi:hypothetical protein
MNLWRRQTAAIHRPGWWSDATGAITTEYVVLVGVCGIVISVAIAALGIPLVTSYNEARSILISTVP